MAKNYDFSHFDNAVEAAKQAQQYDFSHFDSAVAQPQLQPEMGIGESAVRGLAHGGTFGFSDEIGGVIQGLLDKLNGGQITKTNAELAKPDKYGNVMTGDIGPTTNEQLVNQAIDENRALDKQAQEANPWTYEASNIAGNIVPTVAAGAGMLGKGASTLLNSSGVLNSALVGAGTGALSSAGEAEGGLADRSKEALMGGITGGAVGGAVGVGGKLWNEGIPFAKDWLSSTSQIKSLSNNYELGKKGLKTIGEKAVPIAENMLTKEGAENAGMLADKLRYAVKDAYGESIEEMGQRIIPTQGIVSKVDDALTNLASKVDSRVRPDLEKLVQARRDYFTKAVLDDEGKEVGRELLPNISIAKLDEFKQTLNDLVNTKELGTKFSQATAKNILGGVKQSIANAGQDMAQVSELYHKMGRVLKNLKLGDMTEAGFGKFFENVGGERQLSPAGLDWMQKFVKNSQGENSASALSAGTRMKNASKLMRDIAGNEKVAGQVSLDEVNKRLGEVATAGNYYNTVMKNTGKDTVTKMGQAHLGFAGVGNAAGLLKRDGLQALKNFTPDMVKEAVDDLMNSRAVDLAKKIATFPAKDNIGKNALIFQMEQSHGYRDLVSKLSGK